MKQNDLFGGESGKDEFKPMTLKARAGYRKAIDTEKLGGTICKNCAHCLKTSWDMRNYYKCELIGTSSCTATDIALTGTCPKFKN